MDDDVMLQHSEKEKLLVCQTTCDKEDRLGKLPDFIVHHILSFLPTVDAVRMSVLSTQWINIKYYITSINLDDSMLISRTRSLTRDAIDMTDVVEFVDRALCLEKLRLSFRNGISVSRADSLISTAVKHRSLKELTISLPKDERLVLPCAFFTCKSLTRVELTFDVILRIPSSVCMPSLKYLRLHDVTFFNEESTERFFSSLPVLEELILIGCELKNVQNISLHLPTLKNLELYLGLPLPQGECVIDIHVLNLTSLTCSGYWFVNLLLHDVDSLLDADIDIVDQSDELLCGQSNY